MKVIAVAVAVVTRDRGDLLARHTLPSLAPIAARGLDVVVVDQSEGEETERLVRGAEGMRYLRAEPGLSRGRNEAVRCTRAPLIAFTDDDVTLRPDWPERIADLFGRFPEAGAVCGRGVTESGRLLPGRPAGTYRWPANPFGLGSGFNIAFRRAALEDAGPFHERLGMGAPFHAGEDSDMLYRVLRAGWTVVCSDEITVVHHQWRTGREEIRAHYRYGVGAGAQTGIHVRAGDRVAGRIALREARHHLGVLARATLTLRPRVATLQVAFLAGMTAGYRGSGRTVG